MFGRNGLPAKHKVFDSHEEDKKLWDIYQMPIKLFSKKMDIW